jgi:hypothetical protein
MAVASLIAIGAFLVIVGIPLRVMLSPITWPIRMIKGLRRSVSSSS